MGGGSLSRLVHMCRAALGAIAIIGLGTGGLHAQLSILPKPAAVKQAKRTVVSQSRRTVVKRVAVKRAATNPAVDRQTPQAIAAPAKPTTVKPTTVKAATAKRSLALRPSKHARQRRVARRATEDSAKLAERSERTERTTTTTITLLAGGLNSTDLAIADDLAAVLDDGDGLRILPMVGRGGGQSIRDLRLMKGVDLGLTQANLLARFRAGGEFGPTDKIVYVAKLFNEELHLLVRADSGFTSVGQLAGKTVSLGPAGGGGALTGRDVLERLGVKVREVNLGDADAIEKLKTGEIDAAVLLGGKPTPAMARLEGFHLLPVPFVKQLQDDYLPATLAAEDYPHLIDPGRPIDTVAVGVALIAYNWPKDSERYRRIEKFVEAFFPRIAALQASPRHPKWREVNLAAVLPGAPRFAAAQDWLKRNRDEAVDRRPRFERFVSERQPGPVSSEDRERLFREFLQWSEARERR